MSCGVRSGVGCGRLIKLTDAGEQAERLEDLEKKEWGEKEWGEKERWGEGEAGRIRGRALPEVVVATNV